MMSVECGAQHLRRSEGSAVTAAIASSSHTASGLPVPSLLRDWTLGDPGLPPHPLRQLFLTSVLTPSSPKGLSSEPLIHWGSRVGSFRGQHPNLALQRLREEGTL